MGSILAYTLAGRSHSTMPESYEGIAEGWAKSLSKAVAGVV
jgi:hypothetical protein